MESNQIRSFDDVEENMTEKHLEAAKKISTLIDSIDSLKINETKITVKPVVKPKVINVYRGQTVITDCNKFVEFCFVFKWSGSKTCMYKTSEYVAVLDTFDNVWELRKSEWGRSCCPQNTLGAGVHLMCKEKNGDITIFILPNPSDLLLIQKDGKNAIGPVYPCDLAPQCKFFLRAKHTGAQTRGFDRQFYNVELRGNVFCVDRVRTICEGREHCLSVSNWELFCYFD
jgi:hypothetical protein